tara:strand:+ start:1041 stop:1823 length:783 start_codon:yes stop_codon:yes gene_type:complete
MLDRFSSFLPIHVSGDQDIRKEKNYVVEGVASSEDEDSHGDVVVQKGIDWSYFLKRGWINYEHTSGITAIVGIPTEITTTQGKTILKSKLWGGIPLTKQIIQLMREAGKAGRNIGYSIEGKVLERDGNKVLRSKILNVSLVAHPANPDCSAFLQKGMNMEPKEIAESVAAAADKAMAAMEERFEALTKSYDSLSQQVKALEEQPIKKGVTSSDEGHPNEAPAPQVDRQEELLKELSGGVDIQRAREIHSIMARLSSGLEG